MASKIEIFSEMTKSQPHDPMIWYGLANEYIKLADWAKASEALHQVVQLNPDYTAAYQLLGSALLSQGLTKEACSVWQQGISVAIRTGADKAQRHMERLWQENSTPKSGFCS